MNVRRLEVVFALTLVLMMYLYPLATVGLWLLMGELPEYREAIKRSLIVFIASLPLYGAKIALGISGWANVLGVPPRRQTQL